MTETALLEPPAVTPVVPTSTGPLADLILVRLLPPSKGRPSPKKLRDDVSRLFPHPPPSEGFADALAMLRADGLITPRGQHLTDTGRTRALHYLGIAEVPHRCQWKTIQARYLVPKALGLDPKSEEAHSLVESKTLVPRLIKRECKLPVGTPNTEAAVLEALVCQKLGYPQCSSVESLLQAVYAKVFESPEPLPREQALKLLPRKKLGAAKGGADAARAAVITRLTANGVSLPSSSPVPQAEPDKSSVTEPFDLEVFARTVIAAARTSPTGRFGDNKVFINHVWRQLRDQPQIAPLGLSGFKARLVEANQRRLLTLSRADLVQMLDPTDVRESETHYLGGEFHFVLIERA